MSRPLVTFTSDFGLDDWFVGVVHGVIVERCPDARVVDITHAIPPGDIQRAVFVLGAAARDFPAGTVHLVVVDPGVGTARAPIAIRAHGQYFVGPDNGVLESALADPAAEVRMLRNDALFRRPVSDTFHGRDVFAPVAAALAHGLAFAEVGPLMQGATRHVAPRPQRRNGELHGVIMFVDRFGNLITNLVPADLEATFPATPPGQLEFVAGGRHVRGLHQTYGDAPLGEIVALEGSSGRLEIAQVGGSASHRLGLTVGDEIHVRVVG
jgi:hypothetical protein